MTLLKLVKDNNFSVFEKMLIVLQIQCMLHLVESLSVFAEDDKIVVLVVQHLHSGNDCRNQT